MSSEQHSHLLVAGAPRSGTTLLAAMLGSHPDVAMLNEDLLGSFRLVIGTRVRGTKLCIPNQIDLDERPLRFAIGFGLYLLSEAVRPLFTSVGLTPPRVDLASRDSLRTFVDLPNSTIVGILRDPHDVIASIRRRGRRSRRIAEHRWCRAIAALSALHSDPHLRQHLLLVDYDLLVTEPAKVMERLLDAVGCKYDDAVLAGYTETPQYETQGIFSDRAGARGDRRFEHEVFNRSPTLKATYRRLLSASISV